MTKDITIASRTFLLLGLLFPQLYAQSQPANLAIADVRISAPGASKVTTTVTRSGPTVNVAYSSPENNGTTLTGALTLTLENPPLTVTPGSGFISLTTPANFTGGLTVSPGNSVKSVKLTTDLGAQYWKGDCDIYSTNAPSTVPRAFNCQMTGLFTNPLVNNWAAVMAQVSGIGLGFEVTVYYSWQPTDSVRFLGGSPVPGPGTKLPHSTKRSFRAQVNYALVTRARAQMALRLYDKAEGGDLQGSSDFFTVTRTGAAGENFSKLLGIIDFDVPKNLREVFLQAVLIDEVNPGILAKSDPVRYSIPEFTVSISSIEAVQTVQTADNRIPLVPGKSTLFRVFVKQDPEQPLITGMSGVLSVSSSVTPAPRPVKVLNKNPVSAHGTPNRNNAEHSLNFLVDSSSVAQDVNVAAYLEGPEKDDYAMAHDSKNAKEAHWQFAPSFPRNFEVRLMRMCLIKDPADPKKKECGIYSRNLGDRLKEILPLAAVQGLDARLYEQTKTYDYPFVIQVPGDKAKTEIGGMQFLNWFRRLRLDTPERGDIHVALMPHNVDLSRVGMAQAPWRGAGMGRVAFVRFGAETPLDSGQWTLVHEVGHTLGLRHTNTEDGCAQMSRDEKTNWNKFYSDPGDAGGDIHDPGFDPETRQVLSSNHFDVMTYCPDDSLWISPFHQWQLMRQFQLYATKKEMSVIDDIVPLPNPNSTIERQDPLMISAVRPAAADRLVALAEPADFLLVSGWASRDGQTGGFDPVYRNASTTPGEQTDPQGEHCLELHGATGKLSETCFHLDFTSIESTEPMERDFLATRVAAPPGLQRMVLARAGKALATLTTGAAPVTLSITSPISGNRWEGPQPLAWNAISDGAYKVDYSNDDAATWSSLVYDLSEPSYVIQTQTLPGPGKYIFRVTAASGLDSAIAISAPVEVVQRPKLELPSAPINFGELAIGSQDTRTITLSSNGSGPLIITAITPSTIALEWVDAREFPIVIGAGEKDTLTFRLNASAAGRFTESIQISSSDAVATGSIAVEGVVLDPNAPRLVPPDTGLDFGNVNIGQSRDLTLTVRNTGGSALSLTSATLSDTQFRLVSPVFPASVAAGAQAVLTFRFSPSTAGPQSSTLIIQSNDPLLPQWQATFRGTGVGSTQPQNLRLDFGNVNVGQSSEQSVTLRNTGAAPLTVSSAASNNLQFTASTVTPFTVPVGGQQTVTVKFTPSAAGTQTATLTLTTNDPGTPTVPVALTGTGVAVTGGGTQTIVLQIDDGSFERGLKLEGNVYFVNSLTPPSYPATLKSVRIQFGGAGLEPGTTVNVLAGSHASTSEVLNLSSATLTGTLARIAQSGVEGFQEFSVAPITITSGDFVVGFVAGVTTDLEAIPVDMSSGYQQRSYVSRNGTHFDLMHTLPGALRGNFSIRAVVEVGK